MVINIKANHLFLETGLNCKNIFCDYKINLKYLVYEQGQIFIFSQEGWKNFRWSASHMQYAILDASDASWQTKLHQGVKQHSSGVKHFLRGGG